MLPSDSEKSIHHWGIKVYTDLGAGGKLSVLTGAPRGQREPGPVRHREPPGPAGGAPRPLYFYHGMFAFRLSTAGGPSQGIRSAGGI